MPRDEQPLASDVRLVHLLHAAHTRLTRVSAAALAPHGVDGHDLAVLAALADGAPLSQAQTARRLGLDRTTTAALLDGLEDHGLVRRRRCTEDRRRNLVELTPDGLECLRRAERAHRAAERRFLAPLDEETATTLVRALRALTATDGAPVSAPVME
ncbi:MarR family winged helix-turn-helix transcriptional regulator [Streptomyces griseosporeus]|uniref:MarR family winged helix-turn-helix transcriptional regulator n=1 Tax=Streptomyces griseosporeus TaxID=1910 RepID=UPI0037908FD0